MELLKSRSNIRPLFLLACCLFLAYLLPFHVTPYRAFYNDWLAILGGIIFFAYYAENKKVFVQAPWIILIPVSLVVIIAIQVFLGMLSESWNAILPITYLIVAMVAIVLGASITADDGGSSRLCLALSSAHLLAGLVSVIIASLQFVGGEIPFSPFMMLMPHGIGAAIRPYANIAQSNQLALLFCMAIASVWWLFQGDRIRTSILAGTVLILLWGLALTQSRIGWIIIPMFALTSCLWRRKTGFRVVSNWFVAGLVFIYAILVIALPDLSSRLGVVTASAAERAVGAGSERFILFQQALKISLSHPWFGAGWAQFGPQQLAIASDFPASVYAHHSHNIVLNFAAELGWPITIIVFGMLAYWFYKCCLFRSVSKQAGFAMLFFMAVLVHSLVEYPLWYAYVLLPLSLLIGMVHQEQLGSIEFKLSRHYVIFLLIVMLSGLIGIAMDYRRVVAGFTAMEWEAMGMKFDAAATDKPSFTIFPDMYDYFQFMGTTVHGSMSSKEIAFMERTTKNFGGALVLTRMSQVYALNGRQADAVKALLTIRRLHPSRYEQAYEDWRKAPAEYQNIFRQLPVPDVKRNSKIPT